MARYKKNAFVLVLCSSVLSEKKALAYSWLNNKPSVNRLSSITEKIKGVAASGYSALYTLLLSILMIAILLIALHIQSRDAQVRENAKYQLRDYIIGAIIFFGVLGIVSLFITIGKQVGA